MYIYIRYFLIHNFITFYNNVYVFPSIVCFNTLLYKKISFVMNRKIKLQTYTKTLKKTNFALNKGKKS